MQSEGEALARKNGELESALRKLRSSTKESEGERERLQSRWKQQDELLSQERGRFEKALAAANQQVDSSAACVCCSADWRDRRPSIQANTQFTFGFKDTRVIENHPALLAQVVQFQASYEALQQQAQEQINEALHESAAAANAASKHADQKIEAALQAAYRREEELEDIVDGLRAEFEVPPISPKYYCKHRSEGLLQV